MIALRRAFRPPYLYAALGVFLAYTALNVVVSQFYVTAQYIPHYLDTLNWPVFIGSLMLSLGIGGLIALNGVLAYIAYKERQAVKKASIVAGIGTIGGLATGVCAACVTGLVPLIFGALGITVGFGALPFKGMEVQFLVLVLLGINLLMLRGGNKGVMEYV